MGNNNDNDWPGTVAFIAVIAFFAFVVWMNAS